MANWTNYRESFPEDEQAIIQNLESLFSGGFGIFQYEVFAQLSPAELQTKFQMIGSTEPFVVSFATFFLDRANAVGIASWGEFFASFAAGGYPYLSDFIDYYSSTEFGEFQGTSASAVAADLVSLGGGTDFWLSFGQALEMASIALDLEMFASSFPSADVSAVTGFITYLQAEDAISEVSDIPALQRGVMVGHIDSLGSTDPFIVRNAQILITLMTGLLSQNPPDDTLEEEFLAEVTAYYDKDDSMRTGVSALIESLKQGTIISSVKEIATLSSSTLSGHIATLGPGSRYLHGLSNWFTRKALTYLNGLVSTIGLTRYEVLVRFTDSVTGQAIGGYNIKVLDKRYTYLEDELGSGQTDARGLMRFAYEADLVNSTGDLDVEFEVYDLEEALLVSSGDLAFDPETASTMDVSVTMPAPADTNITIDYLENEVGVTLSTDLKSFMTSESIANLEDIRLFGGLARSSDPKVQNNLAEAQKLDAHAQLELISSDAELNEFLIDEGYPNLDSIADQSRAAFITAVTTASGGTYNQYDAARVWNSARQTAAYQKVHLMGHIGDLASGAQSRLNVDAGLAAELEAVFAAKCDCDECTSGVSPVAYLASLLDYSEKHVKLGSNPADPDALQALFYHPFCELPADCKSVTKQVCQVRVAVEVLRQYLEDNTINVPYAKIRPYLDQAYALILSQIGTSLEELRTYAVNGGTSAEEEAALARRIGIDASRLPFLYMTNTGTQPILNEERLEKVFGLQDTERNPLSDGYTIDDSYGDIYNWQLRGVYWLRNTDEDGLVYVEIDNGVSPATVKVYRDAAKGADDLVADGSFSLSQPYTALLSPKDDRGLSGRIELVDIHTNVDIKFQAIPKLLAWRLARLREQWQEQEWPESNTYFTAGRVLPFVEPDWMSPADIRGTMDSQTAASSQPMAARIWINRREWLDGTIIPDFETDIATDLDAVFDTLTTSLSYSWTVSGSGNAKPWDFSAPSFPFQSITSHSDLWNQIRAALVSATDREDALDAIQKHMRMDMAAFERLSEIQQKSSSDYTDEDKADAVAIATNIVKRAFYPAWISEEDTGSITLTPDIFWNAIQEPMEGDGDLRPSWEPFFATTTATPFIDPDIHTVMDLAGPGFGDEAHEKRSDRILELKAKEDAIFAEHITGYADMVDEAYGSLPTLPTGPFTDFLSGFADLPQVLLGLNSIHSVTYDAALEYVNLSLKLTEQEFREMMVPVSLEEDQQTVSQDGYRTLARILTKGWKRATKYSVWVTEETSDWGTVNPWKIYRPHIAPWSGTMEDRSRWLQGLAFYNRVPLVDPDMVVPGDIFNPEFNNNANLDNPAYVLWRTREDLINNATTGWLADIAADTVADNITTVIGTSTAELQELQQLIRDGVDVSGRLAQLKLSPPRLAYIVKMIGASSPTDDELATFHDIILQVKKEKQYGAWIIEERTEGIVVGPDMFVEAYRNHYENDVYLDEVLKPWRSTRKARKAFDDRLESRIMQHEGLIKAHWGMVDYVESSSLRSLRDILIMESGAMGSNLAQKADYLTDLLLTDMEIQCCQPTTRVAAAIETLQRMFHGIRTAQLDEHPTLALDGNDYVEFDKDWKWLGSYGTWRGLMFVYLYPENLLLPSLRPYQTGTFKSILEQVRNNPRLTPTMVCRLFGQYEEYLRDLKSLKLGAMTTLEVFVDRDSCCVSNPNVARTVNFFFARGGETGKVYWSSFEENSTNNYAQSFWEPVPGLENVDRIVDSFSFITKSNDRYLYVFAIAKSSKSNGYVLIANRLNLNTYRWQSDLEEFATDFNVWQWVIGKRKNQRDSPVFATLQHHHKSVVFEAGEFMPADLLGFDVYDHAIRFNQLDDDGLTWKQDEFDRIDIKWVRGLHLEGAIHIKDDAYLFFTKVRKSSQSWGLFPLIHYKNDNSKNPDRWFYPGGVPGNLDPYGIWPLLQTSGNLSNAQNAQMQRYLNRGGIVPDCLTKSLAEYPAPTVTGQLSPGIAGGFDKLHGIVFQGVDAAPETNDIYMLYYGDGSQNSRRLRLKVQLDTGTAEYKVIEDLAAQIFAVDLAYYGPCFQNLSTYVPQSIALQASGNSQNTSIMFINQQVFLAQISMFQRNPVPLCVETPNSADRCVGIEQMFLDNQNYTAIPNTAVGNPNLAYLNEAYYSLPVLLAEELQKNKFYTEALDLFRLVYDYSQELGDRKIYPGLRHEENLSNLMGNAFNFLDEPENPHTVAAQRTNSYTRYTIFSLVRCLLDYADQEFTRDTAESVPRASMLYKTALELLQEEFFDGSDPACGEMLGNLDVYVDDPAWRPVWERMKTRIEAVNNHNTIIALINGWTGSPGYIGMAADFPDTNRSWEQKMELLEDALQEKLDERVSVPNRLCNIVNQYSVSGNPIVQVSSGSSAGNRMMQGVSMGAGSRFAVTMQALNGGSAEFGGITWLTDAPNTNPGTPVTNGGAVSYNAGQAGAMDDLTSSFPVNYLYQSGVIDRPFVPFSNYYFCVPRNPVPMTLLLHAELNLHKIRNCRNIAGIKRSIEPYAAATDTSSGMPVIGAGGTISFPGAVSVPPSNYRYEVLLARAKELVSHAQQLEGTLLSILEKRDAEHYSVMRARQDAKIARAGVRLQDLRIREAEGGIDLAVLTRDRSQLQVDGLQGMIDEGLNGWEQTQLATIATSAALRVTTSILNTVAQASALEADAVSGSVTSGGLSVAISKIGMAAIIARGIIEPLVIASDALGAASSIYASFERRKQEWSFQKTLAQHDLLIGAQQIRLAQDRLRVVGQEREISRMQADHSEATLDFLINKFTNYELYDWMSRVMEGVYSFFLHQATGMARMAQHQLAFERQEAPAALIQDDYWAPPSDNVSFGGNEGERVDRKGLTGSARLLQDLTRLDLYAFETKKRKMQITKTISLSQLDPGMFAEFRRTGTLVFRTPMEIFDRDYPGHYLRLIQKVRTTVVALIPPIEGIKARLATTGISRVVTGKDVFQEQIVARGSETVALSSPVNDSGVFELNYQPNEMLNPFEGMGVDAIWEFRMEKASNPFDFSTIADVLLTMEYTALESEDYRLEVIRGLDPERQGELSFSFKYNFPDQWYDLHNPDLTDTPYQVEIELRERDFPVNLSDVRIAQVSMLLVAEDPSSTMPVQIELLKQNPSSNSPSFIGGVANPNERGMASTRTGTAETGSNTFYQGNAINWNGFRVQSPAGKWRLNLKPGQSPTIPQVILTTPQATLDEMFKEEKLLDIILIITYDGREPARV